MFCVDCSEIIVESERPQARTCRGCAGPLHLECAMLDEDTADDYCEHCLIRAGKHKLDADLRNMHLIDPILTCMKPRPKKKAKNGRQKGADSKGEQ